MSLDWPPQCEAQLLTTQPKHSHKFHENAPAGSNYVKKRHGSTTKTNSSREKMHPGLPSKQPFKNTVICNLDIIRTYKPVGVKIFKPKNI